MWSRSVAQVLHEICQVIADLSFSCFDSSQCRLSVQFGAVFDMALVIVRAVCCCELKGLDVDIENLSGGRRGDIFIEGRRTHRDADGEASLRSLLCEDMWQKRFSEQRQRNGGRRVGVGESDYD